MKSLFIILLIFLSAPAFSQNVDYPEFTFPCGDYPYELIWSDEFDDGVIDASKWLVYHTWVIEDPSNMDDYAYVEENVCEENGYLKILTKNNYTPITILNGQTGQNQQFSIPYTSGEIYSYHRNEWLYGKFEARIKIAGGYGLWPAYWLFGSYPYWNEVDIFEFYKTKKKATNGGETKCKNQEKNEEYQDRRLSTNIRVDWRDHNGSIDNNPSPSANAGFNPYYDEDYSITDEFDHLSTDFHIYTLEWDPYKIVWKLDGVTFRTYYHYMATFGNGYNITSCDYPLMLLAYKHGLYANFPMELYFNTAIQQAKLKNDYNCLCPDEAHGGTTLPEEMEIDYIRIYKKAYCQENIYVSSKLYKDYETEFIHAGNIDVAGNSNSVLVAQNADVSMIASSSIQLHPGFHAVVGCQFHAGIEPCEGNKMREDTDDYDMERQNVNTELYQDTLYPEFNKVYLYPNPNNGCFTLNLSEKVEDICIFDYSGALVPFEMDGLNICCQANSGVYMMRVVFCVEVSTIVFTIQK
ncbi:MAG: glycoside hydrolase family 16 protein [Bacteroidales bacterium]|nr:glycoside hydrolase family 16 protein [Bacteroidales bacterium]